MAIPCAGLLLLGACHDWAGLRGGGGADGGLDAGRPDAAALDGGALDGGALDGGALDGGNDAGPEGTALSVSAACVHQGDMVTLRWTSDAGGCTGSWVDGDAIGRSGEHTLTAMETTRYAIDCEGSSASRLVFVEPGGPATPDDPYLYVAPFGGAAVDGDPSEFDGLVVSLDELLSSDPSLYTRTSFAAGFGLRWDAERLYVHFTVNDRTPGLTINAMGSFDGDYDGVELMLNTSSDAPNTALCGASPVCYGDDDYKLQLAASPVAALESFTDIAFPSSAYELEYVQIDEYRVVVELSVRWDYLLDDVTRVQPGYELGMNAAALNRTVATAERRREALLFRGPPDPTDPWPYYRDTSLFGRLYLACEPPE